jgi:hypothetical protein
VREDRCAPLFDANRTMWRVNIVPGSAEQDVQGIWSAPSGANAAWFKNRDGNVLSLTPFTWKSRLIWVESKVKV